MLEEATMTQFRAAVEERIAELPGSREQLATAVSAMAAAARQSGATAEQMVISIKREWRSMVDAGIVPHGAESIPLRDSVISAAIKAYYVQ